MPIQTARVRLINNNNPKTIDLISGAAEVPKQKQQQRITSQEQHENGHSQPTINLYLLPSRQSALRIDCRPSAADEDKNNNKINFEDERE
jgi:hypothetical protein